MSVGGFEVKTSDFGASLRELSALNGKSQADNLLSFARTTLTNPSGSGLIDIMPPGSQGVTGIAAKRQGEAAIQRDLSKVFIGVVLKHERREQYPDVEAIHNAHLATKRPGTPMRPMRGTKYYVDRAKLRALSVKLRSHVGRLASGLLVAAHRLGVKGPAWIERHGAGAGDINIQLQGPSKSIEIGFQVPDAAPVDEIERRVKYVEQYTAGRIQRAVEGAVEASARKAGFKVAS